MESLTAVECFICQVLAEQWTGCSASVVCLLPPAVRARGVQCDAVSLGDCQRAAARGEDALGVEGLQIALAELGAPRTEFPPTHDINDTPELFHSITVDCLTRAL